MENTDKLRRKTIIFYEEKLFPQYLLQMHKCVS